jgi:hypothetical protein
MEGIAVGVTRRVVEVVVFIDVVLVVAKAVILILVVTALDGAGVIIVFDGPGLGLRVGCVVGGSGDVEGAAFSGTGLARAAGAAGGKGAFSGRFPKAVTGESLAGIVGRFAAD